MQSLKTYAFSEMHAVITSLMHAQSSRYVLVRWWENVHC